MQELLQKPFVYKVNDNCSVEITDPILQIFRFYRHVSGGNACGITILHPFWLRFVEAIRQFHPRSHSKLRHGLKGLTNVKNSPLEEYSHQQGLIG